MVSFSVNITLMRNNIDYLSKLIINMKCKEYSACVYFVILIFHNDYELVGVVRCSFTAVCEYCAVTLLPFVELEQPCIFTLLSFEMQWRQDPRENAIIPCGQLIRAINELPSD